MKAYLVGGAVRDALLGLPVIERDWVVVGAGPDAMRRQGFLPADRDFPVFLHPQTGEEYALARREVKRGEGYRGFEVDCGPDVTLEEDLRRRDLTVNAMAQAEDGTLIDPFGGRDDLDAGLLRHVSPAFVEDPLRILRIARFAAKLGRHGFRIAHATHQLLCRMVERGDLAHLSRERVWRETTKAMQTGQPWRYFEVLHRCGALHQLVPPLAAAMGERQHGHGTRDDSPPIAALKRLAVQTGGVAERLAAVLYGCVDDLRQADDLLRDLRADRVTANLLRRVVGARPLCERIQDQGSVDALFEVIGIWRGFDQGADIRAEAAVCAAQWPDAELLRRIEVALPAARAVSVAQLRAQGLAGEALGRAVAKVRRDAMHTALQAAGLIP